MAAGERFIVTVMFDQPMGPPPPPCAYTLSVTGGDGRPMMAIHQASDATVQIAWPTFVPDYDLEVSDNLLGGWKKLDPAVRVLGSQYTVSTNWGSTAKFFRLLKK